MTPDQMRDASMLELFSLEADAQTQVLNTGLIALERNPTQADQLEACMRAAHSLKGAARIVGIEAGVRIAHVMEDCLVAAQEGRLGLRSEHIDALLLGTDLLLRVANPKNPATGAEADAFVESLEALLKHGHWPAAATGQTDVSPAAVQPVSPPSAIASPEPVVERPSLADDAEEGIAKALMDSGPKSAVSESGERVLRVTAERLNSLLDLSSKTLVETQRLQPLMSSMQRLKRIQTGTSRALEKIEQQWTETLPPPVQSALEEARQLLGEAQLLLALQAADLDEYGWQANQRAQSLYDMALACRMRPFADVLVGQARMVRDLGRSLGKKVRLVIEGEKVQVDRDVLEKLEAPLTHLLRNAVDHGIELPEQRLQLGKPEEGTLRLRASHQAGLLKLELLDDGGGVDLERLRKHIVQRQLSVAETAEVLSEDELLSFLFLPGFSLRDTVTDISGRGVGLDAVQHSVRQLRGNIELAQTRNVGSHFQLEVPLTLSVVRSLVVMVGGEAYAFPLAHIECMRQVLSEDIVQIEGRQHFWHAGRHIGLVAGSQLLHRPETQHNIAAMAVVVIRERDTIYGIAVERFVGERTLVVMPLDARLGKIQDIAAGALLADGTPVLIVDVEDMLRSVEKLLNTGRVERIDQGRASINTTPRKRILVVDDSLTVRELERKLLLGRGYEVTVAVDGMDGWNALRAENFDLVITDIDMPRMDGIELVSLLRRDARLQSLPVMVVSYKDREEDRRRGLDAGADYYLAKASFHDEALLDAVLDLIGAAQG